jgi:phosphoribosylformylglycinamidine cyclo-ligase
MYKVFNMGVGFILIVKPFYAQGVLRILERAGEKPFLLGRVSRGRQKVRVE